MVRFARPLVLLAPMVALFAGAATRADEVGGEEPAALAVRIEALQKQVDEHKRAGAMDALLADIQAAKPLFEEAAGDAKLQEQVVRVVGPLAGDRHDALAVAALGMLATLGHEEGARYVKSHLKPYDAAAVPEPLNAAIAAAAAIASESLVPNLIKMVEKSENFDVAARAMRALGKFGHLKRQRTRIMEALIKTTERVKPGGVRNGPGAMPGGLGGGGMGGGGLSDTGGYGNSQGGAGARWAQLSAALPETLNEMTGQRFPSAEDWFDFYKQNKRNLDVVFRNN